MKPKTVVTVDKAKITMDDMLYPIYEVESQYASYNEMYMQYMGTSFWDSAYQSDSGTAADGVTNSIAMKSSRESSQQDTVRVTSVTLEPFTSKTTLLII